MLEEGRTSFLKERSKKLLEIYGSLMIDWDGCPIVVRREGTLSGAPALRADPRVPPEVIVENMDDGMSAEAVIETYCFRTPLADVLAVYAFAKRQLAYLA